MLQEPYSYAAKKAFCKSFGDRRTFFLTTAVISHADRRVIFRRPPKDYTVVAKGLAERISLTITIHSKRLMNVQLQLCDSVCMSH